MEEHVCPWWVGYILASPLRKLIQNPNKILKPHINPGNKVLDVGSAMGFFTLPAAEMVGSQGTVYAVDLQKKMLDSLIKRAQKKGLDHRITPIQCTSSHLNLEHMESAIDTIIAIAVVHEVPEKEIFFKELFACLKKNGTLIFMEPGGHVKKDQFEMEIQTAELVGFKRGKDISAKRSHGIILKK